MNEVAASLIYVYFREALYSDELNKIEGVIYCSIKATEDDKAVLLQFNSWEFAEADIYSVF